MVYLYFCTALLLSLSVIIFGYVFTKKPPRKINHIYGYRTTRSMKNQDTWDFAHRYAGRLWVRLGIITIVIFPGLTLSLQSVEGYDYYMLGLVIIQVAVMFLVIPFTEKALKKVFNQDGNRKK